MALPVWTRSVGERSRDWAAKEAAVTLPMTETALVKLVRKARQINPYGRSDSEAKEATVRLKV